MTQDVHDFPFHKPFDEYGFYIFDKELYYSTLVSTLEVKCLVLHYIIIPEIDYKNFAHTQKKQQRESVFRN